AFFTLADGVLTRPLGYVGSDRLVDITEENAGRGMRAFGMSPADYRDLVAGTDAFSSSAFYDTRAATARIGETLARVSYAAVSGDFFKVFVDRPLIGRTLVPEEAVPGASIV